MNVAILGPGRVGVGLAKLWVAAGHEVVLSFGRDEVKLHASAASAGARVEAPADAVAAADVVVLATPFAVISGALEAAGDLSGKTLIDCTNNLASDGQAALELILDQAPDVNVVKAFNTAFATLYDDIRDTHPDLLFCGDDAEAKAQAAALIRDAGYEPLDAGSLAIAADMEAFARVVMAVAGQGRGAVVYRFGQPTELERKRTVDSHV
ncbi:MAG: NAD(P)-binding domain-containing protein [Gaiellaceae bacterium MAG52_C11]|nr:NAD(P)-binding domain-containing protein [Candidatus Gaiellasilicea maunaloa]